MPKPSDPIARKSLRAALRLWRNSQKLGAHLLARLNVVEARRRSAGYGDTPTGYGVALRDILFDALRALRPEDSPPDSNDKRWRSYLILSGQYLDGRAPDYLVEQLSIARSTYDHEQATAFDSLVNILHEWEQTLTPGLEAGPPEPNRADEPEVANILSILNTARDQGLALELIRSVNTFYALFEARGLQATIEPYLQQAEAATRKTGDRTGLSETLGNLGRVAQWRGDYTRAEDCYGEALTLARAASAPPEQIAALLQGMGTIGFKRGDYTAAENYYADALALSRQHDLRDRRSGLLANMGALLLTRGDSSGAEACFQEGLTLARALGNRARVGALLINLGVLAARQPDLDRAESCFQESLELARAAHNREQLIFLLTNLGTLSTDRANLTHAESYFQEALSLARELDDRARISHLLANLGAIATKNRNHAGAETFFAEGLAVARAIGHKEIMVLSLVNWGDLERARGNVEQAQTRYEEGLRLAKEIGHQRYIKVVEGSLLKLGDKL